MSSYRQYKKDYNKRKIQAEKDKKEKNTIRAMEKASAQFAERKTQYLEDAKNAYKEGDTASYEKYISLVKNIMFQKAQVDDMLINYKMARDLRDMGKIRSEFSETLDNVMTDVATLSDGLNLKKTEKIFEKGIYSNQNAAERLQQMLELNGSEFSNYADTVSDVRDSELKKIVEAEAKKENADIDAALSEFEAELGKTKPRESQKEVVSGPSRPMPGFEEFDDVPTPSVSRPEPIPESSAVAEPEEHARPEKKPSNPEGDLLSGNTEKITNNFGFDWDSLPVIRFDDIAGLDSVKQEVREKVLVPLEHPEIFEGFDTQHGGGMLLYGPPGTGKTMIASAIANEIGAKFCSVKPSDLLQTGVGNTEKAVRELFAQARSFSCAVIYFDEMDSITPKNTKSQISKQLRSELLAQLQGTESYGKETGNILFLIAATNKPWEIDSAFLRPGRFGTRIYVGLPDDDARRYMVQHALDKIEAEGLVGVDADVDVDDIVDRTNTYNGSDITNLLNKAKTVAAFRCVESGEKNIKKEDFDKAFESVRSTVQVDDIVRLNEWRSENM
ncbi:MAG: AAA family ATPase [Clostridia bacterium]|nr:AAA family ATPase [Clostridia bacterium]